MRKYQFLISGSNVQTTVDGISGKYGFVVNMVVEAGEMKAAEDQALAQVRREIAPQVLNPVSEPPLITVMKSREIDDEAAAKVPKTGLVWYPEVRPVQRRPRWPLGCAVFLLILLLGMFALMLR